MTRIQRNALQIIAGYQRDNGGVSPTCEEIRAKLGNLRSKSAVQRLLVGLERRGLIRRLFRCARAIEIMPGAIPPAGVYRWNEETKELEPMPP